MIPIIFVVLYFHQLISIQTMEFKSPHACQTILQTEHEINQERSCPSSLKIQPTLYVSLVEINVITTLEFQTSMDKFLLSIFYTRDATIDSSSTVWRSSYLKKHQENRIEFEPKVIAKHFKFNFRSNISVSSCVQLKFFGCPFTDGLRSYEISHGTEPFLDETYDGFFSREDQFLRDGLGQLSDGLTGPDDPQQPDGIRWVGWQRSNYSNETNRSVTIIFNFVSLRNFSRVIIHTNNFFPRNILTFNRATIEFLPSNPSESITFEQSRDEQFDMARAIIIDLKFRIASQLKMNFSFDSNWLLISEVTFDSFSISTPISSTLLVDHNWIRLIASSILLAIIILLLVYVCKARLIFRNFPLTPSDSFVSSDLEFSATVRRISPSNVSFERLHLEGVCGNVAMKSSIIFPMNSNELPWISKNRIELTTKISNEIDGEIYHGEAKLNKSTLPVTVRQLKSQASISSVNEFFNEIQILSRLCHPNLIQSLALCSKPNLSLMTECVQSNSIDLHQYLRLQQTCSLNEETISNMTIDFGSQLTSALAYLESFQICHRDIAARNCFLTVDRTLKLHDLAICNELYADDYVWVRIGKNLETRRAVRWCARETICSTNFTTKSDVFSFGVLLWEILTLAERPHRPLTDEQVIQNLRSGHQRLIIPDFANDLTALIQSSWNDNETFRPTFCSLNEFFRLKRQ